MQAGNDLAARMTGGVSEAETFEVYGQGVNPVDGSPIFEIRGNLDGLPPVLPRVDSSMPIGTDAIDFITMSPATRTATGGLLLLEADRVRRERNRISPPRPPVPSEPAFQPVDED